MPFIKRLTFPTLAGAAVMLHLATAASADPTSDAQGFARQLLSTASATQPAATAFHAGSQARGTRDVEDGQQQARKLLGGTPALSPHSQEHSRTAEAERDADAQKLAQRMILG
jgi:hypothetical protein